MISNGQICPDTPNLVPEFIQELAVELDDASNPLGAGRKECGAKMQGAFLLTKARSGHDADASGVK